MSSNKQVEVEPAPPRAGGTSNAQAVDEAGLLELPKGKTPADAKRRKEARDKLLANVQRDRNAKRRIAEAQAQEEHVRQTQTLVEEHNQDRDGHQAMEKMVDSVREKLEKEAAIEEEKKKKVEARKAA